MKVVHIPDRLRGEVLYSEGTAYTRIDGIAPPRIKPVVSRPHNARPSLDELAELSVLADQQYPVERIRER